MKKKLLFATIILVLLAAFSITLACPIILYLTVCHSAMGLIVIPNYKLLYINTGIQMK